MFQRPPAAGPRRAVNQVPSAEQVTDPQDIYENEPYQDHPFGTPTRVPNKPQLLPIGQGNREPPLKNQNHRAGSPERLSDLHQSQVRRSLDIFKGPDGNSVAGLQEPVQGSSRVTAEHPQTRLLVIVMCCTLLFAMLASLWRPTFLAVLTSSGYLSWYLARASLSNNLHPLVVFVLLVIALILDLSWLSTGTPKLWRTEWVDSGSQSGLRTFTVFISYLLFIAEFVASFLSASISYSILTKAQAPKQQGMRIN